MNEPNAISSERALLGLLLSVPDQIMRITADLGSDGEVFSVQTHKSIYSIIGEIFETYKTIDTKLLIDRLSKGNILDDVGGPSYILQLTRDRCTVVAAEGHVGRVVDTYMFRKLLEIVETISEDSLATSVPIIPIEIPISAFFKAGASFIPSPVTATISLFCFKIFTILNLSSGLTLAKMVVL